MARRTGRARTQSGSAPIPLRNPWVFYVRVSTTDQHVESQLHDLREQSAFEHGREIGVADVIEAIEIQAAGAQDLKTSVVASGFVLDAERSRR
jgi:hypothetical protein